MIPTPPQEAAPPTWPLPLIAIPPRGPRRLTSPGRLAKMIA